MRKLALSLSAVLLLLMSACGGGSGNQSATKIAEGNWSIITTSTSSGTQSLVGGSLVQVGNNVSGVMHILSNCFDMASNVAFTGSIAGNDLLMTSIPVNSQVVTFRGTVSGDTVSGTYSVSGGCANGDSGSISAMRVPSISGAWKGNDANGLAFTLALNQESLATTHGMFSVSGTISAASSTSCYPGGTLSLTEYERDVDALNYSAIFGNMLTLRAFAPGGHIVAVAGMLDNPAQPTSMTVRYTSEGCSEPMLLNLTKQ